MHNRFTIPYEAPTIPLCRKIFTGCVEQEVDEIIAESALIKPINLRSRFSEEENMKYDVDY